MGMLPARTGVSAPHYTLLCYEKKAVRWKRLLAVRCCSAEQESPKSRETLQKAGFPQPVIRRSGVESIWPPKCGVVVNPLSGKDFEQMWKPTNQPATPGRPAEPERPSTTSMPATAPMASEPAAGRARRQHDLRPGYHRQVSGHQRRIPRTSCRSRAGGRAGTTSRRV